MCFLFGAIDWHLHYCDLGFCDRITVVMQTLATLSNAQIHAVLGQRLKAVRLERGIDLPQASVQTGIPARELSRIEQGEKQIYASHIARLSHCYAITPNELFLGLAHSAGISVSEADIAHLMERFLKIDQPSRGDMFKGLVAGIAAGEPKA